VFQRAAMIPIAQNAIFDAFDAVLILMPLIPHC
jgi:hypothetical protein